VIVSRERDSPLFVWGCRQFQPVEILEHLQTRSLWNVLRLPCIYREVDRKLAVSTGKRKTPFRLIPDDFGVIDMLPPTRNQSFFACEEKEVVDLAIQGLFFDGH
jgi:hypothetical protein